jgi:hypothetical protein
MRIGIGICKVRWRDREDGEQEGMEGRKMQMSEKIEGRMEGRKEGRKYGRKEEWKEVWKEVWKEEW